MSNDDAPGHVPRGESAAGATAELAPADPLAGAHLGSRYRVERHLGTLMGADVYGGRDLERGSGVRLEVFDPHLTASRRFADAFGDTLSRARELTDPSTLAAVDHGSDRIEGDRVLFAATKPFRGRTLAEHVREEGLPSVGRAAAVTLAVLESLEEAHRIGVPHGEVSASALVLDATDEGELRTKVAGYGWAALAARAVPFIGAGCTGAAAPYRAPERDFRDEPTPLADLYSAGAILYFLLSGVPPLSAPSPAALARVSVKRAIAPPSSRVQGRRIGAALEQAVMRALAPRPDERWASAAEMHCAIAEAVAVDDLAEDDGIWTPASPAATGREKAVRALVRHAASVVPRRGSGHVAIVLGAAGSGKSTVVDSVLWEVEALHLRVFRVGGRVPPSGELAPFIEMLRAALDLERGAGPRRTARASSLLEALEVDPLDVERAIDVAAARPSARRLPPPRERAEVAASMGAVVRRLLESAPAILAVEDADLLDPASRRLVSDLVALASRRRFGVLLTGRYDPWPEWNARHSVRVELEPLDEAAARAVVRGALDGGEVSDAVADELAGAARGSPWLLTLRARACAMSGALALDGNGAWRGDVARVPNSAAALVGVLASRLAVGPRNWLFGAALAAERVPLAFLDALHPASESADEMAADCCETGLVTRAGDALEFVCEGARLATQELVPPKEARAVHRKLATWLASGDPPRASDAVIAEHLLAARDPAGAAIRFERAARELLARESGEIAAQLLESAHRAWSLAGDARAVERTVLLRTEALLLAGDTRTASDLIARAAIPEAKEGEGANERALLDAARLRIRAKIERARGRYDRAIELLERAIGIAAPTGDAEEWYAIECEAVSTLVERGSLDEAHEHALVAVEVARTLDKPGADDTPGAWRGIARPVDVTEALSALGKVELARGRVDGAIANFESAAEEAASVGDEASGARALANLAHALAGKGEYRDACGRGAAALALAERAGDRDAGARIALAIGGYAARMGDDDQALAAYQTARRHAAACGWTEGARLAKEGAARVSG